MVFGGIRRERLQLNDNTLWSGYPQAGNNPEALKYLPLVRKAVVDGDYASAASFWKKMQGPYSARYLHMANLFVDFAAKDTIAKDYVRTLDLDKAIAFVSYTLGGVKYNREVFISHPDKVLVMRLSANKKRSISFNAILNSKLKYKTSVVSNDHLVLRGKAPMYVANRESEPLQIVYDDWNGEGMNFEIHLRIKIEGGTFNHSESSISVSNANAATLYMAEATSFNG